jgi:SAM-dependent methyltransferase
VSSRPGSRRPASGGGGRLHDLGQDFDRGHRTYVENLTPAARLWLRTKPFGAPPNEELAQCLRTFAHLVELLQLGLRAQVLDVGCGPGWLSEFLARCGYWVTGVDISPDMVEIARERVAAIDGPVGEGVEAVAEFHALPVREMPWTGRFDAAVLYDTMHHFDNELDTLEVVRRTLVPGGQLYIHEGVKPPPGSEAERNLVAEMERYGTLESPFDPAYLVEVVERAGFGDVRRLVEVDELLELDGAERRRGLLGRLRSTPAGGDRALAQASRRPTFNIVHAFNPAPGGTGAAADFLARIELGEGGWLQAGDEWRIRIAVTNAGRAFWPAGRRFPFPKGAVTVAPYVAGADGGRERELARAALPQSVSPGETVEVELVVRPEDAATGRVAVDLVREGLQWFSEGGSEPLVLPAARA